MVPGRRPGPFLFSGNSRSPAGLNWHDEHVTSQNGPGPHHQPEQPSQPDRRSAAAVELLEDVRAGLRAVELPLALPGSEQARREAAAAAAQLDDYILPRYRSLDAPLLAVVGGSTGAGKSTLVNALAGHPVTRAGAIRPTTRQPILLHHPAEGNWFEGQRVLPGLSRIRGSLDSGRLPGGDVPAEEAAASSLILLAEPAVPAGVAILDAPDVDSISDENRRLAGQLLAAADLWVFVTTANRYADAVPWKLLVDAASRDIMVAIVLDRVPPGAEEEVSADLRGLLDREGLGGAQLFVVHETALGPAGMLPPDAARPLRMWLEELAADAVGRSDVARRTLNGAVRALAERVTGVAGALEQQEAAAASLEADATAAYGDAVRRIMEATRDGALLRGEVLARWQDFVGTGEFFRALEQNVGRFRDRLGAFFRGEPTPAVKVETAIETGLQAVILDEAATAAEETDQRWRSDPAGRNLLGTADLSGAGPGFAEQAAAEIRGWQAGLMELIRTEGQGKRTQARWLSFGVNGLGAALMIVVFSMTAGLTGLEIGIAGGTAVVGQRLLEAVFGEDAVRRMAATARDDLAVRCRRLLDGEKQRFLTLLPAGDPKVAGALSAQASALARLAAAA
ncbi:dynamin family protein [Pseudarthrobacter sp. NPDC058362]|uniref:dynamin family protein n=1 Tax=Pseudarthrobacter sp. NPDC058362 TaxID=3346458 RepID=UPI00364DC140